MLEKLKTHWQIYTVIFVFWCFFDLYDFYKPFGIEIQHYISSSEIIFLVLPSILHGIYVALLILSFTFLVSHDPEFNEEPSETPDNRLLPRSLLRYFQGLYKVWKIKEPILYRIGYFILALFMIILVLTIYSGFIFLTVSFFDDFSWFRQQEFWKYINFSTKYLLLALFCIFLIGGLDVFTGLCEKSKSKFFQKFSDKNSPLFSFIVAFVVLNMMSNQIDFLLINSGKGKLDVSFAYANQNIKTDIKIVYIGETSSSLFLRNCNDSSNIIYRNSEIHNIVEKVNTNNN